MNHLLNRLSTDTFFSHQTFFSLKKYLPHSVTVRQSLSNNAFKSKSVIITRIKKQPTNYNKQIIQNPVKDNLLEKILSLIKAKSRNQTRNKSKQDIKMNTMRVSLSSSRSKTCYQNQRKINVKQSSFQVIPLVLQKKPCIKQFQIGIKTSRPKDQVNKSLKESNRHIKTNFIHRSTIKARYQKQQKQSEIQKQTFLNREKRCKELIQRRRQPKVARFMGQQISPW